VTTPGSCSTRRSPSLAVAAVLVFKRAQFLVVVLGAAGTAALLRAVA
jgi:hypothetical protein